jgi:hypothetical protein
MKRLAVLLPVLLLATACNGSDDDQVAQGLSKAAYLSQAEAICATANTDIKALQRPTSIAAVPGFVEKTLQIAEVATGKIKGLEPPAADKAQIKAKVLDPLDGQVTAGRALLEQVRTAVKNNDTAAIGRLIQNPPTGSKADLAWMRSYGFKACVEAADTSR